MRTRRTSGVLPMTSSRCVLVGIGRTLMISPRRRFVAGLGQAQEGLVPRVGIEPTLLAERDFESRASTDFATEAGAVEGEILPQRGTQSPIRGRAGSNSTRGTRRLDSAPLPPHRKPAHAADAPRHPGPAADQRGGRSASTCSSALVHALLALWPVGAGLPALAGGRPTPSCTAASRTCSSTCSACGCSAPSSSALWGPKRFLQFYFASVLTAAAAAAAWSPR